MQDDSQAAARWRRDMRRSILRIANDQKKSGDDPKFFFIEDRPHVGPFLSREEAVEWIEKIERAPAEHFDIEERAATGSLNDVLRFIIAYADGELGASPGRSDVSAFAVRDRVRDAQGCLAKAMEILEEEVL